MGQAFPFTEDDLRRAAGPTSYARGLGYLDQVQDLKISGAWVAATVFGNDVYRVRLRFDTEPDVRGVSGNCSCPFGAEGNFCKHCVAAGLAALKSDSFAMGARATAGAQPEPSPLLSWLSSLSAGELLLELLNLLVDEPQLRQRFELRAAARQADAAGVRDLVSRLINVADYVGYDQAGEYADDVTRAAEAIEELIDAGAAESAIEVARDAIEWLRQSFGVVDDSSGEVGTAGYQLLDVHLLACQTAPPDPVELAQYLADLSLTDEYGLTPAFADYRELLGDLGRAALREHIATAYEASPDDYRVRRLMETVLEAAGDVDALVALYAAHLDERGWQQLRIAHALDSAGRAGEALAWAERGVRSASRPDPRLVDYLAGRYTAAGRAGDLLALRRTIFAGERTLANYRALRDAATGSSVWAAERENALVLLRKDTETVQHAGWAPWDWRGPVLIDALIDDGDLDAAWTAARDKASEAQWIRLADACAGSRPADALAVYVTVIERLTQSTGDKVYRQIATYLLAVRSCHQALGTMDKFRQYMVLLRMGQKRKRNLMKVLDESGL